ncbi:MAG TPA: hypothetical protein VM802_13385 [Chitinophaga sp.]|uniref:hypothetical protein n=1 Tax=Chitinophaga sp. TaxID=1869181 RepID=UPI002B68FC71|nr:hypothetical protein [Chitinophaga sp.]HVI45861.1 hypothetical protein [Chitinophaga sp.]
METIRDPFGRNTGILLGRSLRHILHSMNAILVVVIIPVVLLLLFVHAFSTAVLTAMDILDDIFFTGINKKRKK